VRYLSFVTRQCSAIAIRGGVIEHLARRFLDEGRGMPSLSQPEVPASQPEIHEIVFVTVGADLGHDLAADIQQGHAHRGPHVPQVIRRGALLLVEGG